MCVCGRAAIARGLCRPCYKRAYDAGELVVKRGVGRPRKHCATYRCQKPTTPSSVAHCEAHEVQLRYPSIRFGVDEWVAAFGARPDVFEAILDGMARIVARRRRNGQLRLDDRGREIPTRRKRALDAA